MRRLSLAAFACGLMWPAGALAATTPAVATGGASSIAQTTATLNGTVNPEGAATTYYFQIGPASGYVAMTAGKAAGSGTHTVSAAAGVGNLLPATVYHYRLVATNSAGLTYGKDRTFTTTGHPLPVAITGPAFAVGHTWAIITGTVGTNGGVTSWAFQYGTTGNYGVQTSGGSVPATPASANVNAKLTGIQSGAIFHYRLVTYHQVGPPTYGADQTFMTFPTPALPAVMHARTLPRISASKPYVFTTAGNLAPPSFVPAADACTGVVAIRYVYIHRTVAVINAALQPNCTFAAQMQFHRLIKGRSQRLRVLIRFHGNHYIRSTKARIERVRLGI